MTWVPLAGDVASWAAWLWQHRDQFRRSFDRLGDAAEYARAALADPDGAVRRAGNAVVFGDPDAGGNVLAFVEQTAPRLDAVEDAVSGLHAGQAALSSSLASLQAVSMVSLGTAALAPAALGCQFLALNRRLGELQRQVAGLHRKFDAAVVADLKAGLDLLRQGQDFLEAGDRPNARDRLTAALPYCLRTMKFFAELLGSELNQPKSTRAEVRLLARHLSVAVLGVASCQVGLEQDRHAFAQSGAETDLLKRAARWAFHDAVGRDPVPLLHPAMRKHGVTIEFMAALYRQARDAGAVGEAEACSAAGWFEGHRDRIFRARRPWTSWGTAALLAGLREAVAAVEEANRVLGLARLVDEVRRAGGTTSEVIGRQRQAATQAADAGPFAAWAVA